MNGKKLLEVREFDCIAETKKDVEQYHQKYKYLPQLAFEELLAFIREFTSDDKNVDALELMRIGYNRHVGNIVTMSNYVGIIQLKSGYQIQVLPKIDFKSNEKDETKEIFIKMLRSWRDFPSKKIFSNANLLVNKMNLYEIFIAMYIEEVRELVKRGIKSSYISKESNERYFKGKMLISENIKHNLCHAERFFVRFDEFQVNRPENKLIKATLLKLGEITANMNNSRNIRQLLMAFELVEPSNHNNYESDFSQCVIDRTTKDYDIILQWSKVFLMNKSFTSFAGSTTARSLLFPMEKVFESYVSQQIKKVFGSEFEVSTQDKGHYLFDEPSQKFRLIPDIVIQSKDGTKTILDTKWKRLKNNPESNYGISTSDMYQMYAYSKKYADDSDNPKVFLLYPINDDICGIKEPICFKSNDGVEVEVFFVDLVNIDESMKKLHKRVTVNKISP